MAGAWRRNSYLSQMLALLVLASAAYTGPRGYCSPFTARYLTLIDDVLVFHGGQGYILRPKRGCLAEMSLPKHEDRHAVSYIKPFRAVGYNTSRVQRFLFPTNTSGRISTPSAITCLLPEGGGHRPEP